MNYNNRIKYNGGAAMMVLVLFFVFISVTILIGVVSPTVREYKISSDNFKSKQTYFLAESGVEDVIYRLRNSKKTSSSQTLTLGNSETTTTIASLANNQKEITSLGYTGNIERKLGIVLDTGVGVAFSYGVQVGAGGFTMANGSKIIGSVYANGHITGSGSITGSATSANSPALESSQSNGTGVPPYDIAFGNTNSTQDFAQSFQMNETGTLNKIQLNIKKVGAPSSITVRIVTDSNNNPSNTTLTSAILDASLISTNYGWVDIPFPSYIQLASGIKYWIVIDSSTSPSKYFKIGANNDGYSNGASKIGTYNTIWSSNSPSTLDAFFNIYLGGLTGLIDGITVGNGSIGNTYSHTVTNTTVKGINYCQTGSGNNKSCDLSKSDPVQVAMPISEQNIQDWKDAAALGGAITGNYTIPSSMTLGPKKITGNLTVNNGRTLTMSGNIWVQGNLVIENNSSMKLSPGYGTSEGVIVVDGTINISNNATFQGSGSPGSYMMALSTSSSTSAINLSNNGGAVALYASNGTINIDNNGTAISLTGYNIHLNNNAVITYDNGLANANFVSGPSGTWNIESWKEVE
ncbi:MAG: choice-of-anchor R domain-containing protein [Candidatus Nomurabacteria bacterium]